MLSEWWDDLVIEGTPGHELIPSIGYRAEDTLISKHRYDAFVETDLEKILKGHGATEVVLVGVLTNLCVETTARSAFIRDFRVRVLLDATATVSERLHLASLMNLAFGFAHVQETADFLSSL